MTDFFSKKTTPVLVVDEAHLMREAIFREIHILLSGGILRKANMLARGALLAAAFKNSRMVTAEHVRLAATEL